MKNTNNVRLIFGCIFILVSILGIAGILNHILNTGEGLLQPICITVFGAVAALISFSHKRT